MSHTENRSSANVRLSCVARCDSTCFHTDAWHPSSGSSRGRRFDPIHKPCLPGRLTPAHRAHYTQPGSPDPGARWHRVELFPSAVLASELLTSVKKSCLGRWTSGTRRGETVARRQIALLPSQIQAWEQMLHTGRARGPRAKPDAKAELRDGYGFKQEVPGRGGEGDGASHGVAGCAGAGWGKGGPGDGGGEADWPSQPKPGGCWPSSEAKGPAALERAVGEAAAAAATRRV